MHPRASDGLSVSDAMCSAGRTRRDALMLGAAAVAMAWPWACFAQAGSAPPEVATDLPGARLQGRGRLTFLTLHVYDIRLWTLAPLRAADTERSPLALEIEYARGLKGPLIAERSIDEMMRVGSFSVADGERWLAAMTALFPNGRAGDRITGVHQPGTGARFHVNGRFVGEVREAEFARLFFAIWLSPRTSEPRLRQALLGSAP